MKLSVLGTERPRRLGPVPAMRRDRLSAHPVATLTVVGVVLVAALTVDLLVLPLLAAALVAAVLVVVVAVLGRHLLTDLVAGLTLLIARPYADGERIRLPLGGPAGTVEVEVIAVGLLRTTLCAGDGVLDVPNSRLLRVHPDS